MARSTRLHMAQRYDPPPRPFQGEIDRRRHKDEEDSRKKDENSFKELEKWRQRQRLFKYGPTWLQNEPEPSHPRDVPMPSEGNHIGGRR